MDEVVTTEIALNGPGLWAFLAYLGVAFAIGLWATRFSSGGLSEFFLAGRGLNRWVVALSAVVSGRSSWLLLAVSGLAYVQGLSALWVSVGYIVVEFLLFWSYAGRLRRFSEVHDSLTVPDVFAHRFRRQAGLLRLAVVAVILLFVPTYVGSQFMAGGRTFAASFGVSETVGVWATAGIVLAYTVLGGFLAVSLTDMLQALFMLVALVVLPAVAIVGLGGWGALIERLDALDPTLTDPLALSTLTLVGWLGIGLGSPGNPHIMVRYLSIDDPAQLRASALVGTAWNTLMAGGAIATGLAARAWFGDAYLGDREAIYQTLAAQELHPVVFGVVIASVFAAIMSTTDSQLLVAASAVVRDVYQQLLRRGETLDDRRLVVLSRLVVLVLVAASVGLGLLDWELINTFVLLAWAGLGAALGPPALLAMYWRRTTGPGALAGLVAGALLTFLGHAHRQDWFGGLYELVPAFVGGLAVTVLVSLVTRPEASPGASDGEPAGG